MEKLVKIIYNWVDSNNYQYFEVGDNCTQLIEIDRNWIKAIDGNEIHEVTNINHKIWRKDITV